MKSAILITGVSTGIGFATAKYFLDTANWQVYGSVRKKGDANALSTSELFHELVFDVTDAKAKLNAINSIAANGHDLTIVVNNAGIAPSGPLEVMPRNDIREQFEVNVFGALETIQDALPQLHASREKHPDIPIRIINVSSVSSILTSPFTGLYSASKASLECLTDGFRRELMPFNIDCVSVAPGPVKTPIWEKAMTREHVYADTKYAFVLEKLESYIKNTETQAISANEVASTIYHAAIAEKPKTFHLLMKKKWLIAILRRLPSRLFDKLVWKSINGKKRY